MLFRSSSPNEAELSLSGLLLGLSLFLGALLALLSGLSGASFRALMLRPTFSSSVSMLIILTSISSPTLSSSDGFSTCSQEISETWTSPSTPSATSTKAPKSSKLTTLPVTTSPTSCWLTNASNGFSRSC